MRFLNSLLLLLLASCTTWEPIPVPANLLALEGISAPDLTPYASLGIEVAANESDSLEDLEIRPGVRIVEIAPNSPAERAGCQLGDVLLSINGQKIDDPARLDAWLREKTSELNCELSLERGSRIFSATAQAELIDPGKCQRTLYFIDRVLTRCAWKDSSTGPELVEFGVDSPLLDAGLQVGDVIFAVNEYQVGLSAESLVRHLRSQIKPGDKFEVTVLREGEKMSFDCRAWSPGSRLISHSFWPLWNWEYNPVTDREFLMIGDLILISLFKREAMGDEVETSILTFISWKTGVATLESSINQ